MLVELNVFYERILSFCLKCFMQISLLPGAPTCAVLSRPWSREGQESTEEEKISAWGGLRTMEERDSWGGSRVTPEGDNLFPEENLCKLLFGPNFTFTFTSESEIQGKQKFTKILSWKKLFPLGQPGSLPNCPSPPLSSWPLMPRFSPPLQTLHPLR